MRILIKTTLPTFFALMLAACSSPQQTPFVDQDRVWLEDGKGFVMVYGPERLSVGETANQISGGEFVSHHREERQPDTNSECIAYESIAWLASIEHQGLCGGYKLVTTSQSSPHSYDADVWVAEGPYADLDSTIPYAQVSVSNGLLRAVRYLRADGEYFEYSEVPSP